MLLHSQHRFRRHNSRCSLSPLNLQRLPVVILEFRTCSRCHWGVLHCTDYCTYCHHRWYCSDYIYRGITKIVFNRSTHWWKPRSHRSLHAPSRATQRFCVNALCVTRASMHRQTSSRAEYFLHAHPRARPSPAVVSLKWRHHCHVTCWHHRPHLLTSSLTLTEGWLWPLTFAVQVLLT